MFVVLSLLGSLSCCWRSQAFVDIICYPCLAPVRPDDVIMWGFSVLSHQLVVAWEQVAPSNTTSYINKGD